MLSRLARIATLVLATATPALAASSCPTTSGTLPVEAQPAPLADPNWKARVALLDGQIAQTNLSQVRMLFLGDSITEAWLPLLFDQFYGHRAPLNLGVRGDNTQGLLWRLARLPLGASLRPRLVVLLIGTNNLWPGVNTDNVADGIDEVVDQIRRRSPSSHILLVGLLPRGAEPSDPLREVGRAVNARIARCADEAVTFANPGSMLMDGQGRVSPQIEFDYLHPSWIGYAILAAALEPYVRQVMGD
ncbi:MAG: GDSL-type esterase/lipase family protein [Acetobacteraceae bacterium]